MKIDYQKLQDEKTEIEAFLAQPEAYADADCATKSRRLAEVNNILGLVAEIEQLKKNLEEAKFLVEDAELVEMAREDVKVLTQKIDEKETALGEMLVPRDPMDDKPAIMEIRAGVGGDDATLFAGELYRMYVRYAERHGLKVELLSQNENEAGGMKEVIIRVSGENPYGQMKFEGGVHRVQRVPVT